MPSNRLSVVTRLHTHDASLEELAIALVILLRNFPFDPSFKRNVLDLFGISDHYQDQVNKVYGVGTVNGMIQFCQYAIDNLPLVTIVRKLHEAAIKSSCILQYRAFLNDHRLEILKPEKLVYEPNRFACPCIIL